MKSQGKELATMMFAVQFTFAVLLAHIASSERMIGDPGNGERIPLDIKVEGHLVTVVSGKPDPPQPFFTQSINLYDFDAKLEARKIVDDGICYIKVLDAKFKQVEKLLKSLRLGGDRVTKHVIEEWNKPEIMIEPENLENTVGASIAEFCAGYDVYWMKSGGKVLGKDTHRIHKRQSKSRWSVNLKFEYDKGFKASVGLTFKF